MTSMDNQKFSFRFVSLNETVNGDKKLNHKKALQATDIPAKTIKENKDVISFYVFHNFNNALSSCSFPAALKYLTYGRHLKRMTKLIKKIIDPLVSSQI